MRKRILIATLVTIATFVNLYAQQPKQSQANQVKPDANQEITATIKQFINAINGLYVNNPEHSITPVTRMLEPDFESTSFQVDVGGNPRRFHKNTSEYNANLMRLINIPGFKISFTLASVNFVRTYEHIATANISITSTYSLNEEAMVKTRGFVNIILRKRSDGWKLWEVNITDVIKDQSMGMCPCEHIRIGEGDNAFKTKLLVPNGDDFAAVELDFEFSNVGNAKWIKVAGNTYSWENNKITCIRKVEENVAEPLNGTAGNVYEAMNLVITGHLYGSHCIGLRSKGKK